MKRRLHTRCDSAKIGTSTHLIATCELPMNLLSRLRTVIALVVVATAASDNDVVGNDKPTPAAKRAADGIRREVLLPPNGPKGKPLPLASHWNVGTVRGSFEPDHQIGLLQDGHHVLPWMSWPSGDPGSERFEAYYARLLKYYAGLDLPVSIKPTKDWIGGVDPKEEPAATPTRPDFSSGSFSRPACSSARSLL